jgi:hypothetical protein
MPQTLHVEKHFTGSQTIGDIVIGMSDGLTVPFALAAGLSGAVASSHIVVTAGLAEIAAGSIAMGLGGYLAAKSDAEHYASERAREEREIVALHLAARRPKCVAGLSHRHSDSVVCLRRHQGPFHGHRAPAQRLADAADRWLGGGRGFQYRQADLVKGARHPPAPSLACNGESEH